MSAHAHVEIEQLRHAGADRQGKLGAGAQPRVRRDRFLHFDPGAFGKVEPLHQRVGIARRAGRVRPFGDDAGVRSQPHEGERPLQCEPETPVPPARAAVEIDEAHVQPCGRPDGHMAICTIQHAGAGTGYSNRLCR